VRRRSLWQWGQDAPHQGFRAKPLFWYQREAIKDLLVLKIGSSYSFGVIGQYKGPNEFRCDGLVEYGYEQVLGGIGIVNDVNYNTLSPGLQYAALGLPQPKPPSIVEWTYYPLLNFVTVWADDGPNGSGLARVEVWAGAVGSGTLVTSNPTFYDQSNIYGFNVPATGAVYLRIFDQAGNATVQTVVPPSTPPIKNDDHPWQEVPNIPESL
jgi:hypothetical protein